MSEVNDGITETITNCAVDVQTLSELLSDVDIFSKKIQLHINTLNKFETFHDNIDIVSNINSDWSTILEAAQSLECNLKKLKVLSELKQIDIASDATEKISGQNDTEREAGRENKKPKINNPENENYDKQQILEINRKDTIQNESDSLDTASATCNAKPTQGMIRLVPLRNLLSKPDQQLQSSSGLPGTEDDEEIPVQRVESKTFQPQEHIFELSDSEEECRAKTSKSNGTYSDSKLEKNASSTAAKPIEKLTVLRRPSEGLNPSKNRKENTASIREQESLMNKGTGSDCEDLSNTKSDTESLQELRARPVSSVSVTSKTVQKRLTVNGPLQIDLYGFKKKCLVRIKRASLLLINSKLNNRQLDSRSIVRCLDKTVSNNDFKAMGSDTNSEAEQPQSVDNTEESNTSSESEIVLTRKKRMFQVKKNESSASSDSDTNDRNKTGTATRKRRNITKNLNSSSEDESDGSKCGDEDEDKNKKRKKIRKLINEKNLEDDTKRATREEEERKKRIEERQKMYNQIYVTPENKNIDELILDFDEGTQKPLLKVDHGLMKRLKPHQVNGVKFMWDACFETIKDCQDQPGSGCILAHCMGLGKTMQIVTLSHTLLSNYEVTRVERVLIISPLSILNNWAREFQHWISFAKKKNIEVYDMSKYKDKNTRVFKLDEWFTEGGVCIIGYDMYRILSNEKTKGLRKKQKESLQKSLIDPGPDVVVCDEGHLLKNEKTRLSQAVTKMRTKRRIVLTGTPLQNNLKEYYCMIQFIKPNLLGTYKEYLNRFVNPITNGQYTDSTERDIRLMKHRSHILHKMLEACIQRRDYSVLAPYLPPKHEYVVFVTLSEMQKKLYGHYMMTQRDLIGEASGNTGKGAKLFQDFQNLRRIWTHPMNLRVNSDTVIKKKLAQYDSEDSLEDFIDDSDDHTTTDSENSSMVDGYGIENKTIGNRGMRRQGVSSGNESDCLEVQNKEDPSEWWTKFVDDVELNNINHSPKLVILMTLLQKCEEIGDKLLVFSQSLQSLDVIEHFLSLIHKKTRGEEIEGNVGNFKGSWQPGVNYFRLDGSRTVENRESMCKAFNNPSNLNARLFLISTRAGGLGINLVAANRVVIFDVSWNPSHDTQSIFRVYRFGQVKPCYIYRLIASGTMEEKVYERQVAKQATAKRVIDEQQISRHYNQSDLQELYTYELEPITPREIPILPKDRLFAELLSNHEKLLYKYHEHDSLLENEDSENLTEEERKAAWDEYEAEKTRPPQPAMQFSSHDQQAFLANYGNPSGSVTSNKIFGFRSDILLRLLNMKGSQDHPELTSAQVIQLVPEYLQRLYLEMNNGDPTLYKELLELHKSLEAPGGMYMNPLLFANQTPAPTQAIIHPYAQPMRSYAQIHQGSSNFNSNEVYELD